MSCGLLPVLRIYALARAVSLWTVCSSGLPRRRSRWRRNQKIFDGGTPKRCWRFHSFYWAAKLMSYGNVVVRIANLSVSMVGHIRGRAVEGRRSYSGIISEMRARPTADVRRHEAASWRADAARGYEPAFNSGIIAAASTIAALVPQSITAGYMARRKTSRSRAVMAGRGAGIMIGFGWRDSMIFLWSSPAQACARRGQVCSRPESAAVAVMIPVILSAAS